MAPQGRHAQRAEKARGNERRLDLHGIAAPLEVDAQVGGRHGGEPVKHGRPIAKSVELPVREFDHGSALLEGGLPDHHYAIRWANDSGVGSTACTAE